MTFAYILSGIKYKLSRIYYSCLYYPVAILRWIMWENKPQLMSHEQTLQFIIDTGCSVCRFGDGEFNIIWGNDIGFQKNTIEMSRRMKEVLDSNKHNILVCLPDIFGNLSVYSRFTKNFWEEYRLSKLSSLKKLFLSNRKYGNAQITRFSDYKESLAPKLIPLYKKIWDNRKICIVEGAQSRLGVGNDLFSNAMSIERILCPIKDAYDSYSDIINVCIKLINKETLMVIALGPTATILAYDMGVLGYQALDLGHIDLQYEYFIRNIDSKTPIPGKYTNEGGVKGQNVNDSDIDLEEYTNQIIAKIQ